MTRIRPWVAALVGAALLGGTVAFFAITAVRDDHLLRDGTRITATVVHTTKPSAWPLFNSGRVTVRYTTPQGTVMRSIWIDDSANAPHSNTWTVVYDPHNPGRVRSLTDPNDPYPWLAPFLLAGLVGIVLMIGAATVAVRRRKSRSWGTAHPMEPGAPRVLLRRAWYSPRVPYIELTDDRVAVVLPSIFRNGELTVAKEDVWLVTDASSLDDDGEGWVFERPIVLPYANTTATNLSGPNLTLLFTEPVRIPPLRYFGASNIGLPRRPSGVLVDGISLCAADPDHALAVLQAAGIPRTTRPNEWLRNHRAVTHDPEQVAAVTSSARRWRWVNATVFIAALVLIGARFVLSDQGLPLVGVMVAALAAIFALPRWAKRREARAEEKRPGTP